MVDEAPGEDAEAVGKDQRKEQELPSYVFIAMYLFVLVNIFCSFKGLKVLLVNEILASAVILHYYLVPKPGMELEL